MFTRITQRYGAELDATMRSVVESLTLPNAPEFGIMLRYPLGWVDETGAPYAGTTGKRLRPTLLMLSTEACGGDWHRALPAATAVELLHNFSLVHDDIQDDSPTRHGRPTVWSLWGKADAINVGDALFSLAYVALDGLADAGVERDIVLQAWRIFNATNLELTRGQHLDMRFELQEVVTVDEYVSMITGKSAALLAACTQLGALIASGDERLARGYADFGLNLGIAFQIHDDILGIWGDPEVTGKSAATDIISRKKSLPVLYGLSQSPALDGVYSRGQFGKADVDEAVRILEEIGAKDFTRDQESLYFEQALEALNEIQPQGEAGAILKTLVEMLFKRDY